jgi:hypothetical protein
MHNNTFTVVGVSTLNNVVKVRFANDLVTRIKVLLRNKHTDVRLVECAAMNKLQAANYLLAHEDFADAATQAVIKEYIKKNAA